MEGRSRARWELLALFGVALLARWVVFELGADIPTHDERAYTEVAANLAAGDGLVRAGRPETHIAPLFPVLQALGIRLGLEPHAAGRWTGLVTSAAAAPLAAWAFWPLLGRRWAWGSGLVVLLHPRLLVTAERVQPEALAACGLLLFVGWWLRAQPWGVAVAIAVTYLARPEGALLAPLLGLPVLLVARAEWRRWALWSLLAVVLSMPYLIHLRVATGEWTLTGKAQWVYALGHLGAATDMQPIALEELERVEREIGSLWDHLATAPREAVRGYFRRLGYTVRYLGEALFWPLLALALFGLGVLVKTERRSIGLLAPLLLLAVIPVVVVHARHVLPYLPLLLGCAVASGRAGRQRWQDGRRRHRGADTMPA